MFDDDERAPTPTPAPMPEPAVSSVSSVSLAQRVAVIRARVDALARVCPRELDGAGALTTVIPTPAPGVVVLGAS